MKLLVMGLGSIGSRHARNASRLAQVGIFDVDATRAEDLAAETGATPFKDLAQALSWGPDGVVVAVPNHLHLAVAGQAIRAGAHVLVEKPLAHGLDGVAELLDQARSLGRKIFVCCNMRFHPAVAALKAHLHRIGRPLFARAHVGNYLPNMRPGVDYRTLYCARRDQGGGVILDSIHEIDSLSWLLGPVVDVSCRAAKLSDLDIDVEDFACLFLRHDSGAVSEVQVDYLRPFKRRGCEIVGQEGMLLWRSEGKVPEECEVRLFLRDTGQWEILLETSDLDANAPYRAMLTAFAQALAGGEATPLLTGEDAARELAVALAAQKQAREATP